ncbi:HAMP domain-containing sensor histidine kinase [Patulibacter sp. SYSU D01012]|uniref:sensor histidine kinase n=1 Tax=Patulibacter sp. SYSU D01012 TaxID=2817381 RepID=UPI001B317570|nr:HAMP domain-containing sensor histidine kinase [Patulibacter sp. SYSU D01012]
MSARLRLTLSYAGFLVFAGAVVLLGVYVVLRYVPNYPLTAANPRDDPAVASRQEILQAVVGASAVILAGLAVIGLAGGWVLAGWILRPLRDINAAARIAAAGRLDHRIRLAGRHDEFGELADSFDHMLERLHDAFAVQERFAANASHELRTPLTVTATLLDVARADPDGQDVPTLLERLRVTNARAIGLTEALLRLADANAVTAVSAPVDLAAIAGDVVTDHAREARERGIEIRPALEAAPTTGDELLLGQAIANLLQNALRHGRAPGTVRVTTEQRPDAVLLRVENDGPQLAADLAARLVEPFLRGEGRVARDGEPRGHGLGLTLVDRIVAVHAGTLTVTPRPAPAGGLTVEIRLPA